MSPNADLGMFAEIAQGAESLDVYERETIAIVGRRVGFDVAMFKRRGGLGAFRPGIEPAVWAACEGHWSQFEKEFAPVLRAAMHQKGVAVDVEVLGLRRLQRTSVYERLMGPHGGTSTALTYLTRGGEILGALSLGRTRGSFRPAEIEYLRAVSPTLSVCEATVLGALNDIAARATRPQVPPLTPREGEVLGYLHLGLTNAQIGAALGTAERTVRNQLSRVYEKLGVATRAEAVAVAVELGLLRIR